MDQILFCFGVYIVVVVEYTGNDQGAFPEVFEWPSGTRD